MYSILTKTFDYCYECGSSEGIEIHHIFHGADKKMSEELGCMVPLCRRCHHDLHHGSGTLDRKLKETAQRQYLINKFGRCYL